MEAYPRWREQFEREILRAERAREDGNEGMARVCARRAAGIVVSAYYRRRGKAEAAHNVLSRLTALTRDGEVDGEIRAVGAYFILPIDQDHQLPPGVDLIAAARWLAEVL